MATINPTIQQARCNGTAASTREIKKFDTLASEWWDESGSFKALHSFNSVRVPWIVDHMDSIVNSDQPLKGLNLLEIGCGGGIMTEPLCRLGAQVTAIDLSAQSISIAESRLDLVGNERVKENVNYLLSSAEELIEDGKIGSFDVVVMSEVIEHNDNPQALINVCHSLLKPEGKLFITTLNKTLISYLFGIVAAEYILKIVPAGTHEHDKFVTPDAMKMMLRNSGMEVSECRGLIYNPVCNTWQWSDYFDAINYACVAVKPSNV